MSFNSDPAVFAENVTPHDTNLLPSPSRGLYIGVAGDVSVRMYKSQNTVIFSNVPVGILPIQVDRVHFTGTSATSIISLY